MEHNCERLPGRASQYIIYDRHGFAFRGRRTGFGGWEAAPSHMGRFHDIRRFRAPTLRDLCRTVGESARNPQSPEEA